ncbi:putative LPS assembly protein LptD [Flavicella sp.]|uniref:putative LPS assembly protein LptD n=1 Tax=Flavicella sp. TaxID=2957742 RepID=UPI002603E7B2|nr:putative LPS assembly protein LptD [Flavicella sp.]MDG1804480.1 putative LPS assembly protein LptD [Flavicella sp.]
MRTNINHILLFLGFILFGITQSYAQDKENEPQLKPEPKLSLSDSIPALENLVQNDSIQNDSIQNDSLPPQEKEAVDAIIEHTADDYIIEDVVNKKIYLYDNAEITYKDVNIKAGDIKIDYETNTVTAKGIKDSVGEYSQLPVFKQGGEESTQDSIVFNFKTEKALVYGLSTEQDGIYTLGEKMKRLNDSTIFVRKIRFTTSDKANPDYYLQTSKAKVVPGKKIIVGFTHLVVADVPTPVFLPFAYLPLTTTKTSGIVVPTYGQSVNQGFFMQNGGYYFAGNDYFDLTVLGDIYSNGSWGVSTSTSYKKRYKFSGNMSFNYESLIYSVQGFDDYSKSQNYNIRWSHTQDSKANPNSKLSASVNLGSSNYYSQSLNEYNNANSLTNTLSSSVSYYRKLVGTPFNFTASASHSQNTNTEVISMTLPSFILNMDRIYPFAPKSGTQKNAFQKIGLNYGLKAENKIEVTEEDFFKPKMFDEAKAGVQQDVSVSTNMKLMKYFTLSPNANYKEVWYFKSIDKNYDEDSQEAVTDTIDGFTSFREYSAGASISTNIYGMFKFKGNGLKAIRHTMRPSVSYNYKPDFSHYYQTVQTGPDELYDYQEYSPFDGGAYGSPSKNESQSVGMSLNNNLEAKVRDREPTGDEEFKKITLLNNLNFSTSYNIVADSLKWSPVNVTAGTQILNNKMSINGGATLDPYAINANGQRYNTFNLNNNGSLFRLTRANLTMSYSLSNKDFDKSEDKKDKKDEMQNEQNTDLFGQSMTNDFRGNDFNNPSKDDENSRQDEKVQLYKNKIPWTLRLSYSGTYSNSNRESEITNSSLMFTGDVELTPKWKVGASSGFDFVNKGFTYTQLRFSRDLDSWKVNFNWVPFGPRTSYYFYIGVKSPILSDLKYEKRSAPDQRLF